MAVSDHGRGADQFSLRLPNGMRDRLRVISEQNGRSMNAEIVARLEQSLAIDHKLQDDTGNKRAESPKEFIENLQAQLAQFSAMFEFDAVETTREKKS